jgi:hypothetical protein
MLERVKSHLVLIALGTILSGFAIGSIITFTEPEIASISVYIFLYLSIFLFSTGLTAIVGMIIRQRYNPLSDPRAITKSSIRQAVLVGCFVTISLGLMANELLSWWVVVILLLFLLMVEFFFNLE